MQPFQVVSYWDMLEISNANLLSAVGYLGGTVCDFRKQILLMERGIAGAPGIDFEMRKWILISIERLLGASKELEMRASVAACERAREVCSTILTQSGIVSSRNLQNMSTLLNQATQVFSDEMRGLLVFTLSSRHAYLFSEPVPFGEEVEDAFPSASFDITEAAKCRALARWTACVMHLMRVTEAGLTSLAKHYGVTADANWNLVLNQIELKTREVSKRADGAEAEQWAAEAATHLRFVKNAWRNHAMHPRQTYDEERAVNIYDSSRSFMRHLSSKLSEVGDLL